MLLSATSLLFVTFVCISAAPSEGPERIGLPLASIPSKDEALEIATNTFSDLQKAAVDNAMAVNQLISTNLESGVSAYNALSDNLSSGYSTVSERIQSGLSAASDVLSENLAAAENVVTRQVNTVGELAAQGLTVIQEAALDVPDGAPIRPVINVGKAIGDAFGKVLPSAGVFAERPRKFETAILEQEDKASLPLSFKENIGAIFAAMFQPKPVVDTITEEEKYGNTGDRFAPIAKVIVGGTENISSFISNAINIPFDAFKELTRSASAKLNNLGGRFIGL